MPRTRISWAVVLFTIVALAARARADGGQVEYSGAVGPYRVTVFTRPVPLRAGPADVSVLIQDAKTGDAVLDGNVYIEFEGRDPAGGMISAVASRAAATNKLLRAAMLHLPHAGRYRAMITIEAAPGAARAEFDVEAAAPLPPWRSLLAWIVWPAVPIALYIWHVAAAARRESRPRSAAPL